MSLGGREVPGVAYVEAFEWPASNCMPQLWDALHEKSRLSKTKKLKNTTRRLVGLGSDKDTFVLRFKVDCELCEVQGVK